MLFNSFSFLAFFGILTVVYYALPHRLRWPLLLAVSLYFYAASKPSFVILLVGITLITQTVSPTSQRRTARTSLSSKI